MRQGQQWTDDAKTLLKDRWGKCAPKQIASDMRRSPMSIKAQAHRMNLPRLCGSNQERAMQKAQNVTAVAEATNQPMRNKDAPLPVHPPEDMVPGLRPILHFTSSHPIIGATLTTSPDHIPPLGAGLIAPARSCQWIVPGDMLPGRCTHKSFGNKSYCLDHCEAAYKNWRRSHPEIYGEVTDDAEAQAA